MSGPSARWMRARLRRAFGVWVLYEARNRVTGWPAAVLTALTEHRAVTRIRAGTEVPPSRVTTVIPTFRRPESLLAAVRSALQQTVSDHVVLVVDDGGGLPVLPTDPRLVSVALPRNTACVGAVRNVGIALARSPYVAFLDDDNEWYPDHLERALAVLEHGADLVYTGVERVHPDGAPYDVLAQPFDRRTLADASYVDANSVVVRTGRGVRFSRLPRTMRTLPKEDWELVWRLSRTRRTVHVPALTVRYTVNRDSYFTAWPPPPATELVPLSPATAGEPGDDPVGAAAHDSRRNTST